LQFFIHRKAFTCALELGSKMGFLLALHALSLWNLANPKPRVLTHVSS